MEERANAKRGRRSCEEVGGGNGMAANSDKVGGVRIDSSSSHSLT